MVELLHLPSHSPPGDVLDTLASDGAVIIDGLLPADLLSAFRDDMERAAANIAAGTVSDDATVRNFWGDETKRFTRLASRSDSFVDILLNRLLLEVADALLLPSCSSYWMNTGQMMIIGPGEAEQVLHLSLIHI